LLDDQTQTNADLPAELAALRQRVAELEVLEAEHGRAGWASARTLVVDGPRFARSVAATAGEAEATPEGGWRLALGLRGC